MKFQLLKQEFKGVSVPKIVFENLLTAKETDLKVILYILQNSIVDIATISRELNLNILSVQSSMLYWTELGLLLCIQDSSESEKKKKPKMTALDIIKIKETVPEIGILISQIQKIFNTTLNEKHTVKFIELFLDESIPIDAIITLAYYYYQNYNQNPSYVAKVISSSNKKYNFTSAQKAESYIQLMENRDKNYSKIANLFSVKSEEFNSSEKTTINSWFEALEMSYEMIEKSYEIAGSNADIKYCNGILKNWSRKKYKTVQDLEKEIVNTQNYNISSTIKPEDDILLKAALSVPTFLEGE